MSHARIRSVRLKSGGPALRILATPTRPGLGDQPENWRGKIVENARGIAEVDKEITGYAIVAVYADGTYNCATRVDLQTCRVPVTLWPTYVEEVVRRELITQKVVHSALDGPG